MSVKVAFMVGGEPIASKTMSQAPSPGDDVELGKTTAPRTLRVIHRTWRDSNDDWTRCDVVCIEKKDDGTYVLGERDGKKRSDGRPSRKKPKPG